MKIVIPGGSGQVGTILARAFHGRGDDVVVLSRRAAARPWSVVAWDGATLGGWQREIDGCDVVINLTGRSVNCRYTAAHRRGDPAVTRAVDARRRTGDRAGGASAARVAAGEHGHDLRTSIRSSKRRAHRHSWRPGIERPRHVAIQHRRRAGVGTGLRGGRDGWNPEDCPSIGDDAESGSRRRVRHAPRR